LQVYPNPAKNTLNIIIPPEVREGLTIQITDMNGKLVLSENITQQMTVTLNVAAWNSGMYILSVRDEQHTWHQRWIKND
jgi:extracellular elastinolytic metalloproteinase